MLDVAKQAVEAARAAGADYADGRVVADDSESITVRNQEMEGIDRSTSEGLGIRVLVNGYWGFAATARQEPEEIDRTARLAVEIAKAAARLPMEPVVLAPIEPVTGTWHSPMQVDPFNIPLEEKVAMLMEATRRMQSIEGLAFAEGGIDLFRRRTFLATSEGTAIEQTTVQSGAGIEATALGDGELQRRSFPNSFRGHISAAGWEHILKLGLIEEAERTATEAVELLSAKECPSEVTTLVLDSGQVELQIHESIGHPVELDRVLGMEEAYAGPRSSDPRTAAPPVREPAGLDHGRRVAAGRARVVRLGRRGRSGAAGADPGRWRVRELHLEPGDGERPRAHVVRSDAGGRVGALSADPHDEHLDRAARGLARRHHR